MLNWETRTAEMVKQLQDRVATGTAAVILVRWIVDEAEDFRLVHARERDPVAHLRALVEAGGGPIGLLEWTGDGEDKLSVAFHPYEGYEDVTPRILMYMSPPLRHAARLVCGSCGQATVHLVEDQARSPSACLHLILSVVTLGLWLLVLSFIVSRYERAGCTRCGTVRRIRREGGS
jgi:hypothetical protein